MIKKLIPILIVAIVFIANGCMKNGDDTLILPEKNSKIESNGLSKDINSFISEDLLYKIKSMGMPINTGGNPPMIENYYLMTPCILKSSNISIDEIGKEYVDLFVKFSQQNNNDLTITIGEKYEGSIGTGTGGYVVGDGNKFTVVGNMETKHTDGTITNTAVIYSGTISNGGIIDFYYALFMVNDHGDVKNQYIENGQGRVFYDSDGFSEKTASFKSASSKKSENESTDKSFLEN